MAEETMIGVVADFFARPVVAAIELTAPLKVGDKIHIKGHTTDLEQTVDSMQVNNAAVTVAKRGRRRGHQAHRPGPQGRLGLQGRGLSRDRGEGVRPCVPGRGHAILGCRGQESRHRWTSCPRHEKGPFVSQPLAES